MTRDYDQYVRRLEEKRRLTEQGYEYWMARDLLPLLGYTAWEKFEAVVRRAMEATESAGQPVVGNFLRTVKDQATTGPKPADYFLSRYACYLIAINAESSKVEVGYAQTYFAMKTRQMEIVERRALLAERVEMRDRLRDANKDLARAAKAAGVSRFGIFQDEGYRGLTAGAA
jgi:DNA-damage-inducible protein D